MNFHQPVQKYARSPEILEHCARIGRKWDLYSHTLFQTECTEARWDEGSARWICTTDRGDVLRARFLFSASGPLHKPKLPGIPGVTKFKRKQFHTARWDYNYTGGDSYGNLYKLKDKKVAIVGTGATAIQCVPYLGEFSKHLYVFQRTPSAVERRDNKPTDEAWFRSLRPGWQDARDLNFTAITSGADVDVDLVQDGWTKLFREQALMAKLREQHGLEYSQEELLQMSDYRKMNSIRSLVDEIVKDKETAEKLKPWCAQSIYLADLWS